MFRGSIAGDSVAVGRAGHCPIGFAFRVKGKNKRIELQKRKGKTMQNQKAKAHQFRPRCGTRALMHLLLGIVVPLAVLSIRADNDHGATRMRWDIIHISSFAPLTINAGGQASAKANNGSWITISGSGTFLVNAGKGQPHAVTGGGVWETFDEDGTSTASGTYEVTGLVVWNNVEGSPVPGTIDNIGDGTLADNRAGLLVLQIRYSDGASGSMVVSCHLPGVGPPETPETVFEGITATKAFVAYWNRVAPAAGVDGNRTLFHVLPHGHNRD